MLVLSRKCGEAVVIGENITVTVLEVQGSRVKLGFAAPREAVVHRAEVRKKVELGLSADVHAEAVLV